MMDFWYKGKYFNLHSMKIVEELNTRKEPIVAIDPALEKYRGKILFPEKLEKANKMLKTAKLPPKKNQG